MPKGCENPVFTQGGFTNLSLFIQRIHLHALVPVKQMCQGNTFLSWRVIMKGVMKTDFQEFSSGVHVGENRVMLWSSVDLEWQSAVCLCLPSGRKPWILSPGSGQLGLLLSQHVCLGRRKVLVQAAMLAPGPGPQPSYQPPVLVGPKTTCSNWSSTLPWGWKSGYVVSSSFFKRRSGGE